MRGSTLKLIRAFAKASGADFGATVEWWKGLNGPDRERAADEMRRRLAVRAEAKR